MTSTSTSVQHDIEESAKKRILDNETYETLCEFIGNYNGLPIDCEIDLKESFPEIHRLTLRAILETELNIRLRYNYNRYQANVQDYLARYEKLIAKNPLDTRILLNIAKAERLIPAMMCRTLLKFKYDLKTKMNLTKMMRYPHLIDDPMLSANVAQCLWSDSQDGPLNDVRRRILGEEYEFKLKKMANEAGMHFYDENDLRRLGYDKTPDIKMILPFLYKGVVINWIESKANFADNKTHKHNIQQQLNSYCNRFGAGIIIYWFGYHVTTPTLPDNSVGIIVLDNFPPKADIELLDLSENLEMKDRKITDKT